MANNENHKERTITLNKLVPTEYRIWVVQAEATLGIYNCVGLLCGTEPNPTPINVEGNHHVINAALHSESTTGIAVMH